VISDVPVTCGTLLLTLPTGAVNKGLEEVPLTGPGRGTMNTGEILATPGTLFEISELVPFSSVIDKP
jgi:hypothetical protein